MSRNIRRRHGGKRGSVDSVISDLETEIDNISIFDVDKMAQGEKQNLTSDLQTLIRLYELRGAIGKEGVTDTMYKASLILQKLQTDKRMQSVWDSRRLQLAAANFTGAPQVVQQIVQAPGAVAPQPAASNNKEDGEGDGKSDDDKQLEAAFQNMIVELGSEGLDLYINENINVMGTEEVWNRLKTKLEVAVTMPNAVPDINKLNAVILYGPPGTGKTMLARQLAALRVAGIENAKFMSVAASAVESKYHGESARNVRAMWSVARKSVEFEGGYRGRLKRPVVVFFDEFDALFAGGDHSKPVQNEFLTQMDGLMSKNRGVFFVAATNDFSRIPANVMNRFSEQVWLGLPGLKENTAAKSLNEIFSWNYVNGTEEVQKIIEGTLLRYEAPNTFYRLNDSTGDGELPSWIENDTPESSFVLAQNLASFILEKDSGQNYIVPDESSKVDGTVFVYKNTGGHTTVNARSINNTVVNVIWVRNLETAYTNLKNANGDEWILDERERYEIKEDFSIEKYKKPRLIHVPEGMDADELVKRLRDTYFDSQKYRYVATLSNSLSNTQQLDAINKWIVDQDKFVQVVKVTHNGNSVTIGSQNYDDAQISEMLLPEPINTTQVYDLLVKSGWKSYDLNALSIFSRKYADLVNAKLGE